MDSTQLILLGLAAVFLMLYIMRRRNRLHKED